MPRGRLPGGIRPGLRCNVDRWRGTIGGHKRRTGSNRRLVDKLRKIGLWIWYNKERMVLAIMFIALCYQVYKVWNPEPPQAGKIFGPPDPDPEGKVDIPQPLPPLSQNPDAEINDLLRNPFSRVGGTAGPTERAETTIRLLRIIEWRDGTLRAELQDQRERDYFAEGESFGTYEVLSIDRDAGTVEVYSAESNKRIVLNLER